MEIEISDSNSNYLFGWNRNPIQTSQMEITFEGRLEIQTLAQDCDSHYSRNRSDPFLLTPLFFTLPMSP